MTVTFIGVRHHSPACARLVREVVARLRPAHVLVEGPADMNDRMDEVLLGHDLPVAIFTSYRDERRSHASWTPFCGHSPEWVALTEGRRAGAQVRFIDLPAWHPAFFSRTNRYADAERQYGRAVEALCSRVSMDNVDTLWDHLFEIDEGADLGERLVTYFDLVRGEADASEEDSAREAYMAEWVAAAAHDAGDGPVVVVTGGFHRPSLLSRWSQALPGGQGAEGWPAVPSFPEGAVGGSYLVPFSFRRLDAFSGYQSGMPSPWYYQRLWEAGAEQAGVMIVEEVVERLRRRRQRVSTADLVAARTLSLGLARLRGHAAPARADVLDGLVSALVTGALDRPLPWTGRGRLAAGTEPVVVEMIAALAGDAVGRLHPDTPHPPLVHDVTAQLEACAIPLAGTLACDLATPGGLAASRVLHRLSRLGIPGFEGPGRVAGAAAGGPVLVESWTVRPAEDRLPALIEAGSYGPTLAAAAGAALAEQLERAGRDPAALAAVILAAVRCGVEDVAAEALDRAGQLVGAVTDLAGLGALLATTLGLWRHDRLLGAAGSPALAAVVDVATRRCLWLVEGIRGGPAPADQGCLRAIVAVRDAVVMAPGILSVDASATAAVFSRCTGPDRPPHLRGAGVGMARVLAPLLGPAEENPGALAAAVRGAGRPEVLGDFLAGLFAVAREEVLGAGLLALLDDLLSAMAEQDYLVALPALRQAFAWFPPREREAIAAQLLARRGMQGSGRGLLRLAVDPQVLARARAVEGRVADLLAREGLLGHGEAEP